MIRIQNALQESICGGVTKILGAIENFQFFFKKNRNFKLISKCKSAKKRRKKRQSVSDAY